MAKTVTVRVQLAREIEDSASRIIGRLEKDWARAAADCSTAAVLVDARVLGSVMTVRVNASDETKPEDVADAVDMVANSDYGFAFESITVVNVEDVVLRRR